MYSNIFQVFHSIAALTVRSRKKVLDLGLGKRIIWFVKQNKN
jgi:hypothetical protein